MATREELLTQIVEAANGQIIGRIRLQKIIYLLDQLGLNSDFTYSYHHYGPYSEPVAIAIQRATQLDHTISETDQQSAYGGSYSVFNLEVPTNSNHVGSLTKQRAAQLIQTMKAVSSVVIELAATINWLQTKEQIENWRGELKLRKPTKATFENTTAAIGLLNDVGLPVQG